MSSHVEGINTIEESDILFLYASEDDDKDTNTLILNLTPRHRHVSTFYVKPTPFLAGDLAFLAVIMGKDNFSLSWCNWCKYSKAEWQVDCDVNNNDMLWDINGINVQVDCNVSHMHICGEFGRLQNIDPIFENYLFRIACWHWNWQLAYRPSQRGH
jgi:hypothetical protein